MKDLQTEKKASEQGEREQNKLNSVWSAEACKEWNTKWNNIKLGKWNVRNVRRGAKISAELLGLTLPRQTITEDDALD